MEKVGTMYVVRYIGLKFYSVPKFKSGELRCPASTYPFINFY